MSLWYSMSSVHSNSSGKLLQNSSSALKLSLSKEHLPDSQSTKLSIFMLSTWLSIQSRVSSWPKMVQPSGIWASAAWSSERVQLIRSPVRAAGPTTVRMPKVEKA